MLSLLYGPTLISDMTTGKTVALALQTFVSEVMSLFLICCLCLPSGFPDRSVGKESTWNAGDPSLIPGSGRSPGEGIRYPLQYYWASLVAQTVRNPPAIWETWVRSIGWEDPLEKGIATHFSILAWRIPWAEKPGGLQSMESQRVRHD